MELAVSLAFVVNGSGWRGSQTSLFTNGFHHCLHYCCHFVLSEPLMEPKLCSMHLLNFIPSLFQLMRKLILVRGVHKPSENVFPCWNPKMSLRTSLLHIQDNLVLEAGSWYSGDSKWSKLSEWHSETRVKKHLLKPFPHQFQRLLSLPTCDKDQQEWWRRKHKCEAFFASGSWLGRLLPEQVKGDNDMW